MRTYLKYLNRYYFAAFLSALVFSSCTKEQTIVTPTLDVTIPKTTYAVNEPVVFSFTGTADVIAFYSGKTGSEYRYKTRTTVDGKPQIQFTSYRQGTSTQASTLSLLVSKDFSGTYDIDNLQAAKWTDITSRATLSTGTDNTASGVVDLSDQLSGNAPVYIAFRYTAKKDAAAAQPTWTIKNIAVDNKATDGTSVSIGTQANIAWGTINVLNVANLWSFTTAQLAFTGGAINADDNEDWIISQPLQLNRATATFGVSIKPSPTTTLTTYSFTYTAAGTYVATFEATNSNKWDTKTTVKQFTITVQ